jgi:hypothetical protein
VSRGRSVERSLCISETEILHRALTPVTDTWTWWLGTCSEAESGTLAAMRSRAVVVLPAAVCALATHGLVYRSLWPSNAAHGYFAWYEPLVGGLSVASLLAVAGLAWAAAAVVRDPRALARVHVARVPARAGDAGTQRRPRPLRAPVPLAVPVDRARRRNRGDRARADGRPARGPRRRASLARAAHSGRASPRADAVEHRHLHGAPSAPSRRALGAPRTASPRRLT